MSDDSDADVIVVSRTESDSSVTSFNISGTSAASTSTPVGTPHSLAQVLV